MDIIEENINDNSEITANSKQLEVLKKNFPQCFDKNGNFIAHKMEEIVTGSGLELSKESYSLNWLGKSYARLLANENPLTMLKEDIEHNKKEENKDSQNILIKGDNLEVLKHLKNSYENQIKMIYIDPPYNTGDDGFAYNDDRKFSMEELSELAGISLEESKRILEFTESNSNSHSAWLTFMYPRLYIARELLKNDGVIFISIDDNEVAQLKILCDEIYGEETFIGQISWEKRTKAQNTKTAKELFQSKVEYILVYKKEVDKMKFNLEVIGEKIYSEKDNNGCYRLQKAEMDSLDRPHAAESMRYEILGVLPPKGKCWKFGKKTKEIYEKEKRLILKDGWPFIKFRPSDEDTSKHKPFWSHFFDKEVYGTAESGKKELSSILETEEHGFGTVKPIKLIQKLLFHVKFTNNIELNSEDIVLDFFAGSGTTAHSIMNLNQKEELNIKYISVQINESTKTNSIYNTVFDITKDRINKASTVLKKEIEQDRSKDINDYDLGFKIFETTPLLENPLTNMDKFDVTEPKLFNSSTLKDDYNALLTTWKVHDGMKLNDILNEITFKEYKAYYGDKKLYFVNNGFTTEDLKEFIKMLDEDKTFEPNKLIVFGYTFDSKYQREISEALDNYSNKKSIEIDMIVRY